MRSNSATSSLNHSAKCPSKAMPWVWSCHKCHTQYPLGATRRCLHDGHYFCGGSTVDKVTGRTRKHRACGSEFDYIGWEDYGSWRRSNSAAQKPTTPGQKHCEHQCDFPSACHWSKKRSPRTEANFEFLDPSCLSTKPTDPSSSGRRTSSSTVSGLKKTGGVVLDKLVKAAEKRTMQLTTLLSTIDEEKNLASTPGYITAPTFPAPKLPESSSPPSNGDGLNFPIMDLLPFRIQSDDHYQLQIDRTDAEVPTPPELCTSPTIASSDDDVEMKDWVSEDPYPSLSPPLSPTSKSYSDDISFNLSVNPDRGPLASLADDGSMASSPRRHAWDWTVAEVDVVGGSLD